MKVKVILLLMVLGMASCSEDQVKELTEVTVADFTATVNDGAESGTFIGQIEASATIGELTYTLESESVAGAFEVNETTGELTVGDGSVFDYETNPSITGVVHVVSGEITKPVNLTVTVMGVTSTDLTATIAENPLTGTVLGSVTGTTNGATLVYTLASEDPVGAFTVDAASGEVLVKDKLLFDYESRTTLTATVKIATGEVFSEASVSITLTDLAPSWKVVGSKTFSAGKAHDQSIAVHNGIPYVAYRDEANSNKTTVMKYVDDAWTVVGTAGFSQGYAAFQSLAFNGDIPYVAYRDDVNDRKTTVMKFEGGSWQLVGTAGAVGLSRTAAVSYTSEYQSLAFDNGVPYVAYKDWSISGKVSLMKYNGSSWALVGSGGFSDGSVDYVTLKFNNGIPYVAYEDADNDSRATVMKYENSSWTPVGTAGFSADEAAHLHLLFDDDVPYVAYSDADQSGKTTVMKYTNNSWSVVGSAGFTQSDGQYQTLGVMDDKIHVAFRDSQQGGKATMMQYNGTSWSALGTAGFSDGNVNHFDMVVDNNIPYVVYRDDTENANKTTVMRYDDK